MMIEKMKWLFAASLAAVFGILALLYGKKTKSVLRAEVRAHNQRGRVLNNEINVLAHKVEVEKNGKLKTSHIEKAQHLSMKRAKNEEKRLRLIKTANGEMSDADLADHDNHPTHNAAS